MYKELNRWLTKASALAEDEFIEPTTPMQAGETLCGVMTADLRRLCTINQQEGRRLLGLIETLRERAKKEQEKDLEKLVCQINQLNQVSKFLAEFFYLELNAQFDGYAHLGYGLGVRTGWRVVRRVETSNELDPLAALVKAPTSKTLN